MKKKKESTLTRTNEQRAVAFQQAGTLWAEFLKKSRRG